MSTAEELAFSISQEGRGVHVLLWDDQGDLARALLIFWASLGPAPFETMLLASTADIEILRAKIPAPSGEGIGEAGPPPRPLWLLFIQQASASVVGPWLNGWRRPLSDARGTLLLIAMRTTSHSSVRRRTWLLMLVPECLTQRGCSRWCPLAWFHASTSPSLAPSAIYSGNCPVPCRLGMNWRGGCRKWDGWLAERWNLL